MHRLSEKLLALLLTLLLGLSPLTGAMAGFVASFDQVGSAHQMKSMQGEISIVTKHATAHDCEQCNTRDCCAEHDCSSGQCVSCVLALTAINSYHTNLTASPVQIWADDGFVNPLSASPFRPPRA